MINSIDINQKSYPSDTHQTIELQQRDHQFYIQLKRSEDIQQYEKLNVEIRDKYI